MAAAHDLMVELEWHCGNAPGGGLCTRRVTVFAKNRDEALLCAKVFSEVAAAGGEVGPGRWMHSKIDIWGCHQENTDA
jgi:hypothetical protein